MKTVVVSLVACFMISGLLIAQNPSEREDRPPGNALVEGVVQRADSTDHVAGAAVELRPSRGSDPLIGVADERGRFLFKDVPSGEYSLAATRPGYVRAEHGQKKLNGAGIKIALTPGQEMKGVVLSMTATAVISGQIRGSKGLPAPNVQVHAMKYGYEEGRRVLQTVSVVRTNDEGDYRLFWLPPGQYLVMAIPLVGDVSTQLRIVGPDGTARGFRPIQIPSGAPIILPEQTGTTPSYYPGTVRLDGAAPIVLKPGEERTGINLNLGTIPSAHVRGVVTNLPPIVEGGAAGPPTSATVRLEPMSVSVLERKTSPLIRSQVDLRTGVFDIRGVMPGTYNLVATANGGGRNRTTLFARIPLEVSGADIENLKLSLAPAFNATVNVRVEGATDNAAEVTKLFPLRIFLNGYLSQPDPAQPGVFVARSLPPDTYRVRVDPLTSGFVKSVRYEDVDVPDSGLALNSTPASSVEITISLKAGTLSGKAIGRDGRPATNAAVALIPDVSRRKQFTLYRNVMSGSDGTFRITGIAPGDYKLFSWADVDAGAWQDPDFIKDYEELGKSIHIDEGSAANVEVIAIP